MTFILQPLDVDDGAGITRLRDMVERLVVVRPRGPGPRLAAWARRGVARLARIVIPDGPRRLARGALRWVAASTSGREPRSPSHAEGAGHIDLWCWPTTCRAVARAVRRDRPIAVLVEYALLSKCLEELPRSVLTVIDTIEVFFRNPNRFAVPDLLAPRVCSPESEVHALGRGDILIAIQRNDAQALAEHFPGSRVITVPHAYRQVPERLEGPDRGSILYVASSNPFNVHGLREFLAHAWPSILARVPFARLRVVGSLPAGCVTATPRAVHLGRVSDEELGREYRTAHVVINPQVAGTGLKIKCVEALSAGCALVVNRAGADGIEEGEGEAFLVASDWVDFVDHVVCLLTNDRRRLLLEKGARTFAHRLFSPEATFAELASALWPADRATNDRPSENGSTKSSKKGGA